MTNLKATIEALTAENSHTEAAIVAAKAMENTLGNAFAVILEEIDAVHELAGFIEKDQQILRDSIAKEVFSYVTAMGLI